MGDSLSNLDNLLAKNAYKEGVNEGEEPKSFSHWRKQAS